MHKTEVWLRKQLINGETYQMMFTIPDEINEDIQLVSLTMGRMFVNFTLQVEAKNKELRDAK